MSKEVLHRIKPNLYPDRLTDAANNYAAWAGSEHCVSTKETCRTATTHSGASGNILVTQADIYHIENVMQYCNKPVFLKTPRTGTLDKMLAVV